MSKSNAMETAVLANVFQNAAIANIGDATGLRGSTTAGQLYYSLHTSDPGEAGDQTTSECNYTGYARVAKNRNTTDHVVSGNQMSIATAAVFPIGTGGSGTATHFGIGTAASGAGVLLYSGALSPTIATGTGVTPQIAAGVLVTED